MRPPSGPGTPLPRRAKLPLVTTIAELEENRTVEGVYAVARKERLRTRNGSTYLALELVDPSGRVAARVWNDVDLLDGRFEAGDAVRVLGRVERFRNQLQVEVRTLEPAEGVDPAGLTPGLRRDADELEGFLEFLVGEVHDEALRSLVSRALAGAPLRTYPPRPGLHRGRARAPREPLLGHCRLRRRNRPPPGARPVGARRLAARGAGPRRGGGTRDAPAGADGPRARVGRVRGFDGRRRP